MNQHPHPLPPFRLPLGRVELQGMARDPELAAARTWSYQDGRKLGFCVIQDRTCPILVARITRTDGAVDTYRIPGVRTRTGRYNPPAGRYDGTGRYLPPEVSHD